MIEIQVASKYGPAACSSIVLTLATSAMTKPAIAVEIQTATTDHRDLKMDIGQDRSTPLNDSQFNDSSQFV
jgi:hypothetical protein